MYYPFVRVAHLCTYCRAVSESHSSETAAGNEVSRVSLFYILSSPHLVLSDISNEYGFSVGVVTHKFYDILRIRTCAVVFYSHRMLAVPVHDFCNPFPMLCAIDLWKYHLKGVFAITYDTFTYIYIFVYFTFVYVYLQYFCFFAETFRVEGNSVTETAAYSQYHVCFGYGFICCVGTMHSYHSQISFFC